MESEGESENSLMFNGGFTSSHHTSITPNRRIPTLIGLGGVSVVAVATTIWMYKKRNNNNRKTRRDDQQQSSPHAVTSDVHNLDTNDGRQQNEKEAEEQATLNNTLTLTFTTTDSVATSNALENNDEEEEQSSNIGNSAVPMENDEHQQHHNQQQQQLQNKKEQQPTENREEEISGKKLKTDEEKDDEEQQQQQEQDNEEETAAAAEQEQMMLQQQQHQHHDVITHDGSRQTYAGRASIGSTGTAAGGGRQHPVNSICTCERCTDTLNDLHASRGYKNAESPNSTHSEGSADSGRATGHLTSYSPFADVAAELGHAADSLPIYEFEVPNTLVGLIIGVKGKTIKELCTRADVRMLIRPHHTHDKFETHQLCSVEGRRENINKCLHMIRLRFPPCRFPGLNLKPVLPPPLTAATKPTTASADNGTIQDAPTVLTLPVGVPFEVYVSAHVDAGHFFVQLPTHPSFSSLPYLDSYMLSVYTQPGGAPGLPKPCNVGVLCAAPAYTGWFRAITLAYDQDQDEMLVRFVDYGGFARLPRADLRQIRTDFMNLPLQGIECYLANVQPIDGSLHWSEKANELFQQLCVSKIIQSALVGYFKNDGIPCVELFVMDCANKKSVRVDQILLERGLAKPMDPSLIVRTPLQMG